MHDNEKQDGTVTETEALFQLYRTINGPAKAGPKWVAYHRGQVNASLEVLQQILEKRGFEFRAEGSREMSPLNQFRVKGRAISAVNGALRHVREKDRYSCSALEAAVWAWSNGTDLDGLRPAYRDHSGARRYGGFKSIPRVVWLFLPSSVRQRIRIRKLEAFRNALIRGEVVL